MMPVWQAVGVTISLSHIGHKELSSGEPTVRMGSKDGVAMGAFSALGPSMLSCTCSPFFPAFVDFSLALSVAEGKIGGGSSIFSVALRESCFAKSD